MSTGVLLGLEKFAFGRVVAIFMQEELGFLELVGWFHQH